MSKTKIKIGDIVCYKWNCLAGIIEVTGRVTVVRESNVEVYNDTPSSRGWRSVPYENIISVNGKQYWNNDFNKRNGGNEYVLRCSIYEERGTNNCRDIRVDSHLLCGGFKTEDEAMEYIDTHDCSKYDNCCSKGEYPCIEIEEHNEDGSVASVITVD